MAKFRKRSWLNRNKIGNWNNVWSRRIGIITLFIPILLFLIPLHVVNGLLNSIIAFGEELREIWTSWREVFKGAKSSWERNKTHSEKG